MSRQSEMLKLENGLQLVTAYINALPHAERIKRELAQQTQTLYLFGWGVVEDAPEEVKPILDALRCNSDLPQIQRANWLIYAAGLSRRDRAKLIGAVMAVTKRNAR